MEKIVLCFTVYRSGRFLALSCHGASYMLEILVHTAGMDFAVMDGLFIIFAVVAVSLSCLNDVKTTLQGFTIGVIIIWGLSQLL